MREDIKIKNNLKQIRRAKSEYTQQDLGNIAGCTRQTIIALEQNKYNPSLVLALKLAKALNVNLEDIFYLNN